MNAARRGLLLAALMAGAGPGRLRAQTAAAVPPPELAATLPAARLQGRARMRFLGLSVYEARLWVGKVPVATDWTAVPFAIEIEYARTLSGSMIAERSLTEMRRQGEIAADVAERWLATMKTLFPDVKEGDRLTGVHTPGQGAHFFLNGSPRGAPQDETFSRVFFGIWLSPLTSEPALRSQLLGQNP
jgi:hypothetical protein